MISCRWPAVFTIEDRSIVGHWERIWPLSIQSRKRLLLWRVHFWAIIKNIKTSGFRRKTTISWFSQRTKSVSWTIKIHILEVSLPMMSLWMWDLAKILMNFLELQVIQFLNGTWGLINQWKLTELDWGIRLWKWTKITFAPEADWVWFTFMKITNRIQIDSLYTSKSQIWRQQSVIFLQIETKAWFAPYQNGKTMQQEWSKWIQADASVTGRLQIQKFNSEMFRPFLGTVISSLLGQVTASLIFSILRAFQFERI